MARKNRSKRRKSTRRSAPKRRNTNKRKRKSNRVARRRKSGRGRSVKAGFGRIQSSLKSGIVGEAVKGAGAARLSHVVTDRVPQVQQYAPIIAVAAGFMAGGVVGGITAAVTEGVVGGLGGQGSGGGL